MVTLSSEEREERLKHHLKASNDLHPALISSESEYKFLKRIMGAVLAAVLRTREAQCALVRCIVRELLTCLVMQPVMRFASPGFINELIAGLLLANNNKGNKAGDDDQSTNVTGQNQNHGKSQDLDAMKRDSSSSQKSNIFNDQNGMGLNINLNPPGLIISGPGQDGPLNPQSFAWARGLEAKTQRRTEVLQPENLENMWTKGRNYKRKSQKQKYHAGINENDQPQNLDGRILTDQSKILNSSDFIDGNISDVSDQNQVGGPIISEFYSANVGGDNDVHNVNNPGYDQVTRTEGQVPKIRCRVLGAYFENISLKSFAVYSIAVTDADNKTWQVKRRYRNFERLHRHLKAIPNYTLQLPPKRIFSSSTEDAFVHQRCIQLDKYLQDLLSIANIAEQHEVWDFLSMTSKSYCFGRSSSVVRKLAVNLDEAVDDMVRQIKGVSGGLKKKAVGSGFESSASFANRNVSFKTDELTDSGTKLTNSNSFSHNKGGGPAANILSTSGLKEDPFGVPVEMIQIKTSLQARYSQRHKPFVKFSFSLKFIICFLCFFFQWTPTNVSVPLLNLVDNIFQLNRRGWLRRQVFWISKQILQLMMEDAIDDCLLRQIHILRNDTLVAQGIHWVQNILWPGGIFFLKLRQSQPESSQSNESSCEAPSAAGKNNKGSFEEQLEAARRASDIRNMILDGAPTTLVSLIGQKQYKQSAIDFYYFSQVTYILYGFSNIFGLIVKGV
ncbi:uncharacterized protein LOC143551059 [Bidens hawaiensis]|uniref:uncharacterized protein LOC143551059 n=1 Tax=Bidens hawaiensis TaxID=980011 RepID=UPI00404B2CA3